MAAFRFKRDYFCARCGKLLDTLKSHEEEIPGMVVSVLLAEPRAKHKREDGCSAIDDHARGSIPGPARRIDP